jgi:anhydro-N-acetylmuramic acid kinase
LAQRTGITVVGNFRTADIAAGGEGAPMAPAAHRLLFGTGTVAVQNLGGIGNVTLLRRGRVELAFDTGPANLWLDTVIRWKTGGKLLLDRDGALARRGAVNRPLLAKLLSHPYFRRKPPKSAGWEEFGPPYLERHRPILRRLDLKDALATVTFATAIATADAYERFVFPRARPRTLVLAGGGAQNSFFVELLGRLLPVLRITGSDEFGIPPEQLESVCFALLAVETLRGHPSNEPRATGAKHPVTCGEIAWGASGQIDRLRSVLLR